MSMQHDRGCVLERTEYIIPAGQSPTRLDAALASVLGLGLRQARELLARTGVRVDGRRARKGDLVRPGQCLTVCATPLERNSGCDAAAVASSISCVAQNTTFAALAKPAGMHTVCGREAQCVEAALPELGLAGWRLLNRLDFLTSGLVLAAATAQATRDYALWQDQGRIHKWYLAWAHGQVEAMTLRRRILDDQRRVVRVVDEDDEALRWTDVRPLVQRAGSTLVLVRIAKGRRHHIRAHLAHAGHPLLGDPVYGQGGDRLFLHHWRVELPGLSASVWPQWPELDEDMCSALRKAGLDTSGGAPNGTLS